MLSAAPGAVLDLSCHMWLRLVTWIPKKDWRREVKVVAHFVSGRQVVCLKFTDPRKASMAGLSLGLQGRRDFPGGPVAKTPCSQLRGLRFNPWSGK